MKNSTKIDRILSRKTSIVDGVTGEVIEKNDEVRLKRQTREDFFLLFVSNFRFLVDVPKMSLRVLANILTDFVNWNNQIILDSDSRKEIAEQNKTSVAVVYQSIAKLTECKVFIKQGSKLFLNPHIFGRGTWNNIRNMRQEIIFDYDFEKLESQTTLQVSSVDKNMPPIEDLEVIEHSQYEKDNVKYNEVVVRDKKEEYPIDTEIQTENLAIEKYNSLENVIDASSFSEKENSQNDKQIELEILREKNRAKELEIKELELKIKLQESKEKGLFD